MRRFAIIVFCALLPLATWADEQRTFVRAYDLSTPTESADNDQIVTVVNLTNTTFTIAAQPDVPRNVTITVVDTTPSITVGTVTVTGLDVNGATITEVLNLASALTLTGTKVFASVTSVVSAAAATLGGAGDETIIVGTGSVVGYIFCSTTDPFRGTGNIRTVSSSTTVTAATGSNAPFAGLTVGDELLVNVAGVQSRRVITAKASNVSVTVDTTVNWSGNTTTGYPFTYRNVTCGTADTSGWINVDALASKLLFLEIGALSATGGVDYVIQCRGVADAATPASLLAGNVTAAIVPGVPSTTLDPIVIPEVCASLRVGVRFGTTDTAGTDSISAYLRAR